MQTVTLDVFGRRACTLTVQCVTSAGHSDVRETMLQSGLLMPNGFRQIESSPDVVELDLKPDVDPVIVLEAMAKAIQIVLPGYRVVVIHI